MMSDEALIHCLCGHNAPPHTETPLSPLRVHEFQHLSVPA